MQTTAGSVRVISLVPAANVLRLLLLYWPRSLQPPVRGSLWPLSNSSILWPCPQFAFHFSQSLCSGLCTTHCIPSPDSYPTSKERRQHPVAQTSNDQSLLCRIPEPEELATPKAGGKAAGHAQLSGRLASEERR